MSQGPAVTVAVVSWNTRELLVRCLRSLEADARAGLVDVWVVDNASGDGSAQAARDAAPSAQVLAPGENLGFGRAVNLVASRTDTEWLACANADVELEDDAIRRLLAAAGDAATGAVAPRLILPSGATQHSAYPLPTLPFTIAFNLGLHHVSARLADHWCLEGHWNSDRARVVPWAIGAFLLIRRSAFDEVGGFDERRWMYAEDLDLGWRLHDAGWATRYEPAARVRHESEAATAQAFGDRRLETYMLATYRVILRRRGRVRTWITAAVNVLGAAARVLWMAPLGALFPRFKLAAASNRRWFRAHQQGLRCG